MDLLTGSLLDLLHELREYDLPLTVGGGFGLFLKRLHLARTGERTLFGELPAPRATNDLDLFVRAEVLADFSRTRELADAIRRLGYRPVEEAKFLQWKREIGVAGVPGSSFYSVGSGRGKNMIRFAFCKKQETLDQAAERLAGLTARV